MKNINLNTEYLKNFITDEEIKKFSEFVYNADKELTGRTGKGKEFLGWVTLPEEISVSELEVTLPEEISVSELEDIRLSADKFRIISEVIVVVGIGGSYLGARAIIEALTPPFKNDYGKGEPEILYAGFNLSESYHEKLLAYLEDKEYSVIVISKSGTTTEPAIAFRLLKNHIEKKFGKIGASERIIAITDSEKGALKKLSTQENYKTFIIPDDIGGRFSVLTPVGLLPIACAGINITEIVKGAKDMMNFINNENDIFKNPAYLYSAIRNILYKKNKSIEILASYEPNITYISEWWKP